MKKILLIATGGIILLFVATNPSLKDFKEHLGHVNYDYLIRDHNFIVYSTYKNADDSTGYIGVVGNFWKVKVDTVTKSMKDSSTSFIYDTIGNPKETLYDKLIERGYSVDVLGNKGDFYKNIQDERKATKLYIALIRGGYTEQQIGSIDKFIYYMTERQ